MTNGSKFQSEKIVPDYAPDGQAYLFVFQDRWPEGIKVP